MGDSGPPTAVILAITPLKLDPKFTITNNIMLFQSLTLILTFISCPLSLTGYHQDDPATWSFVPSYFVIIAWAGVTELSITKMVMLLDLVRLDGSVGSRRHLGPLKQYQYLIECRPSTPIHAIIKRLWQESRTTSNVALKLPSRMSCRIPSCFPESKSIQTTFANALTNCTRVWIPSTAAHIIRRVVILQESKSSIHNGANTTPEWYFCPLYSHSSDLWSRRSNFEPTFPWLSPRWPCYLTLSDWMPALDPADLSDIWLGAIPVIYRQLSVHTVSCNCQRLVQESRTTVNVALQLPSKMSCHIPLWSPKLNPTQTTSANAPMNCTQVWIPSTAPQIIRRVVILQKSKSRIHNGIDTTPWRGSYSLCCFLYCLLPPISPWWLNLEPALPRLSPRWSCYLILSDQMKALGPADI